MYVLILWNVSALLYVKLNVLEDGVRSIKACKTRRFPPSISVHFRPDKDNSTLTVHLPSKWEDLTCQFSLCTKPTLGKYIYVIEKPSASILKLLLRNPKFLTIALNIALYDWVRSASHFESQFWFLQTELLIYISQESEYIRIVTDWTTNFSFRQSVQNESEAPPNFASCDIRNSILGDKSAAAWSRSLASV